MFDRDIYRNIALENIALSFEKKAHEAAKEDDYELALRYCAEAGFYYSQQTQPRKGKKLV